MSLFSFSFTPTASELTSKAPTLLWYKGAGGTPPSTQMTVTTFPSANTTDGITLLTPFQTNGADNITFALWQGMLGPHFTVTFSFKINGSADIFYFHFNKPDTTNSNCLYVAYNFFLNRLEINGFNSSTVPNFKDNLNHTMVITYNHGAVTASIDGTTYINNVYMSDSQLALYTAGSYNTRYFGFGGWNGGQSSTCTISNISLTTIVPPWASNTIYPEYSIVSHNTYGYILYGMPYNVNSATPGTVTTTSNFTGGWIKIMSTRFARDSRLANNELFYAYDRGLVLYHDVNSPSTSTTFGNYNASTTYPTLGRVWYSGLLFINFGAPTTAAPGHTGENITTPTTTSSWTQFFNLIRVNSSAIINANVYTVYMGKLYRAISNITFASTTANYLPTNTGLYSTTGWANIAYPSGSILQYDNNIQYYTYSSSNTLEPSQNTTSINQWIRLHGSIGGQSYALNEFVYLLPNNTMYYANTNSNLTTTPTEPNTTAQGWVRLYESITNQVYTLNEFVCLGSTKTLYYAFTNTNLTSTPADPNTNGQGWIKATSGYTGSVGHYIYQLDAGQGIGAYNRVQEQAASPWLEAWTSSKTFASNQVVGHLGTGFAAFKNISANNTPSALSRSNLDLWIPFWSQTGQYLQNDYTYFSSNFYNGFTRPTVGTTPVTSSNTTGWIMVYQQTKSYNPNTVVFSLTDEALYRSIRLQSTQNPIIPANDSNNICWNISSIPRNGVVRWSMFRGATMTFPTRPTLNPLNYYVTCWLTASTGVSQTSGTVTAWADQSGNNRTVSPSPAPSYSATGMQGLPSIICNNDQGIQITGIPTTVTEFTIGMIGYMTITGNNQTIMRFMNAANFLIRYDSVGFRCSIFGYTGTFSAGLIQTNTPFIIIAKASITNGTGVINLWVNGTNIGSVTGNGTSFDSTHIYIGSSLNTNTAINGGISDFFYINRAMSTTEHQILEGYMAWTWLGSGASLAANHPFKLYGPV